MSHKNSGSKPVIAALVGNVFITIIKTFAAVFSGSASMFAEGIHSLADTLNQTLLLIGLTRSKRPADSDRGYGYGIERFFWSLLSACGILFIGAGITIYHSIDALIHHNSNEVYVFSYFTIVILCISFFVEGISFLIALYEIRKTRKKYGGFFDNADPVTLAVLYEDGAAVLGVVVVLLAQLVIYITGNGIYDSIAGIIVSLILGFLAITLILKNYQYIIGKSIDEDVKEEIIEFLLADPCIENISDFKSVAIDFNIYRIYTTVEWNGSHLYSEIYEKGDLREEFNEIKDDFAEFTKLTFKMTDRIPRLVGNHIDKIEKKLKEQFPEIAYIDIEIN